MAKKINIAIVDDHKILRKGLVSLLDNHKSVKVLFDASNGAELLEKLKSVKPDVILLDLEMPVMSGDEAFERLKQLYPGIRIIIVSATFRSAIITDYVKKGVNSFLNKDCNIDEMVDVIKKVYEHGTFFDSKVSQILAKAISEPKPVDNEIKFSDVELGILKLIGQGLTSKEIAGKLHLNQRTVEWHRSQMMRRINTKSSAALIAYAVKNKLIQTS